MARYIDADALLEKRWDVPFETNDAHYVQVVDVADIENAPTADVAEVKHGEWITLEAEIGLYSCSLCGHKILRAECNYCPNCGADMRGETNGEK